MISFDNILLEFKFEYRPKNGTISKGSTFSQFSTIQIAKLILMR